MRCRPLCRFLLHEAAPNDGAAFLFGPFDAFLHPRADRWAYRMLRSSSSVSFPRNGDSKITCVIRFTGNSPTR